MDLPKAIHELEYGQGSVYGPEEEAALVEVLHANAPSCGPQVKKFEETFAAYCGVRYGLAVTSGTAGLQLAAIAARLEPGDEVITTPLSWISTANAAAVLGAHVVFADVDPRTLNLNPAVGARKDHGTNQGHHCRPLVRTVLRYGPHHGSGARNGTSW